MLKGKKEWYKGTETEQFRLKNCFCVQFRTLSHLMFLLP